MSTTLFDRVRRKAAAHEPSRTKPTIWTTDDEALCKAIIAFTRLKPRLKRLQEELAAERRTIVAEARLRLAGQMIADRQLPDGSIRLRAAGGPLLAIVASDCSATRSLTQEQIAGLAEHGAAGLAGEATAWSLDPGLIADPFVQAELSRAIERSKLRPADKTRLLVCRKYRRLRADWPAAVLDLVDRTETLTALLEMLDPVVSIYPR